MCNRLGKKAREKIFGKNPVNLYLDEHGAHIKGRDGRPVYTCYTARMLQTWGGLDAKMHPDQADKRKQVLKHTKAKQAYFNRIDNLYMYNSLRPADYSHAHNRRIYRNLARNNVYKTIRT